MKNQRCKLDLMLGNLQINVILDDGFFCPDLPWVSNTHMHSCLEFRYLYEGDAEFVVGGVHHTLKKNTLYIVRPFVHHGVGKNLSPIKKLSVMFSFAKIKTNKHDDTYEQFTRIFSGLSDDIVSLTPCIFYFDRLLECSDEYAESGTLNSVKLKALLTLIFIDMMEKLKSNNQRAGELNSENPHARMNEDTDRKLLVEDFIFENFKNDIKICDLAECLHLSERQTNRFLRERLGMSFTELVRAQRIAHAKKLLADEGMSLSDTCFEVGYKSYNGFSSAFASITGMLPGEYAKKYRK